MPTLWDDDGWSTVLTYSSLRLLDISRSEMGWGGGGLPTYRRMESVVLWWSLPCVPTAPRGEGLSAAAATTSTAAGPVCGGGLVAFST